MSGAELTIAAWRRLLETVHPDLKWTGRGGKAYWGHLAPPVDLMGYPSLGNTLPSECIFLWADQPIRILSRRHAQCLPTVPPHTHTPPAASLQFPAPPHHASHPSTTSARTLQPTHPRTHPSSPRPHTRPYSPGNNKLQFWMLHPLGII